MIVAASAFSAAQLMLFEQFWGLKSVLKVSRTSVGPISATLSQLGLYMVMYGIWVGLGRSFRASYAHRGEI